MFPNRAADQVVVIGNSRGRYVAGLADSAAWGCLLFFRYEHNHRVVLYTIDRANRNARTLVFLDDVVRGWECCINGAAPWAAGRGGRNLEIQRSRPGVHRDVDIAVNQVGPIRTPGRRALTPSRGYNEKSRAWPARHHAQTISGGSPPRPPYVKNVRRRSTGWAFRSAIIMRTNRRKPAFFCFSDQSTQLMELS